MNKDMLSWKEVSREKILERGLFTVCENQSLSPKNKLQKFTIIESSDWAIVVPVLEKGQEKKFVMVNQWRHGAQELSLEFPGGVFEPGEDPADAAARELLEETAYKAGKIKKIGEFSPNPAIMSNKVHFFLAEDLADTGSQALDPDEFVRVELADIDFVFRNMGKAPFCHALMASALLLYFQSFASCGYL
ncbi:MAG: NUDIX hydrolase [Treponema sp.]|nr:NUDIX hydrolase [Treponema sp.]